MVAGSQSSFDELFSLRNYGRVIAKSDTPPFLLYWSDNGQEVRWNDSKWLAMAQFRLLSEYFTKEAAKLCDELMLGLNPRVDLASIKTPYQIHKLAIHLSTSGTTVDMKSCLAVAADRPLKRFSSIAASRTLVDARAMCCLYLRRESMITPSTLTWSLGTTSFPLITIGVGSTSRAMRVKCMMAVFSASNVAPLRLSHSKASSTIALILSRLLCAVGPVT